MCESSGSSLCMKDGILCWGDKSRNKLKRNWGMDGVRESRLQRHCSCVFPFTWWLRSKFTECRLLSILYQEAVNGLGSPPVLLAFQLVLPPPGKTWIQGCIITLPFLTQLVRKGNIYISMTVLYIPYSSSWTQVPTWCLKMPFQGWEVQRWSLTVLESLGQDCCGLLSCFRILPLPPGFSSAMSTIALVIRVL